VSNKPWEQEKPWIRDLNLSLRASWRIYSCYSCLDELLCATDAELLRMGNFGRKSLQELNVALDRAGLVRAESAEDMLRAADKMEQAAKALRYRAKQALDVHVKP
jgi:DNA-directed RNA polymerase alpha subunit